MKKITAAIIAIVMAFGLCGCNVMVNKPEDVVQEFMEALKNKNEEVLVIYTDNTALNTVLNSSSPEQMDMVYDSLMKNLTWKIISTDEDIENGTATVELEVTNSNFEGVLTAYQEAAVQYTKENLQDSSFTKEVMIEQCMNIFAQQAQTAAETCAEQIEVITVNLHKNDSYSWEMELSDEMMDAIFGGIRFQF